MNWISSEVKEALELLNLPIIIEESCPFHEEISEKFSKGKNSVKLWEDLEVTGELNEFGWKEIFPEEDAWLFF